MIANANEIDQLLRDAGYKSFGWANGWSKTPDEVEACRIAGHRHDDIEHNRRGTENTCSCDICKIYWKYDCSD
jgi:hypothetical protein